MRSYHWRWERLYREYVEGIPCVEVKASCSYGINGQHFVLEITNIGTTSIPPYDVVLFHPRSGRIRLFHPKEVSDRLPHQTDTFSFGTPTIPSSMVDPALSRQIQSLNSQSHRDAQRLKESNAVILHVLCNKPRATSAEPLISLSPEEFSEWRLQLILKHSDNFVLFDHGRAGAAIAEIVRDIIQSNCVDPRADVLWRVHAHNSWRRSVKRALTWTKKWFKSRRPEKAPGASTSPIPAQKVSAA